MKNKGGCRRLVEGRFVHRSVAILAQEISRHLQIFVILQAAGRVPGHLLAGEIIQLCGGVIFGKNLFADYRGDEPG